MKHILFLIPVFAVALIFTKCKTEQHFNVGFYNVENLFDTIDNPHKRDNEFLPDGKKKWDTQRYLTKVDHIAKVIDAMPNLILLGLCEVENKHVLADLKAHDLLATKGYNIIHKDSPDGRGIDIAALYKADFFELNAYHYYRIKLPGRKTYSTRDLLYIKGLPLSKDTLHIFINHWPSRYGGEVKTRPDRKHLATIVQSKIDSLKGLDKDAQFLIMGDLNDTPTDSSVQWLVEKGNLINPALNYSDTIGTYNYRGQWDILDQILYSENLKNGAQFSIQENNYHIFSQDFILYEKKSGEKAPNRTYGYRYYGGYSDHLPVYISIGYKR